jgi:hypothetical protein
MTEVRRSASSDRRSYLLTSVDAQNRDINTVQYARFEPVTSKISQFLRFESGIAINSCQNRLFTLTQKVRKNKKPVELEGRGEVVGYVESAQ